MPRTARTIADPSAGLRLPPSASRGPFRLVAIDLDGTLLRSDKRLSKRAVRAINDASARGVKVVLASARPPRSTLEIYGLLNLDTLQVNYNGALILDLRRSRYELHLTLCNQLARRIADRARELHPDVVVSIERLDKWLTDRHDPASPYLTETAKAFGPDFVGPLDECLVEPITKLMLLAPPEVMSVLREDVRREFGGECALFVTDDHLLQVCHPAVEKWVGVAWVARHYGIEASEVMAIGDAPNDAALLKWAGLGVAVANAWPQARESADVIVASNDDDGVAEAIERYVLGA